MEDIGSCTPISSPISPKDHQRAWREAWLDRRCSALGLTTQSLEPGSSLDEESLPPTQWELYNVFGLDAPTREWRDRSNASWNEDPLVWLKRWYGKPDRIFELSTRASPLLRSIREQSRRTAEMFAMLELPKLAPFKREYVVPFTTYSDPIRIPASEVEPNRRLLW